MKNIIWVRLRDQLLLRDGRRRSTRSYRDFRVRETRARRTMDDAEDIKSEEKNGRGRTIIIGVLGKTNATLQRYLIRGVM